MDRLIRLAATLPLADSVFKQPARRRPTHSFFNVIRLTLVIAGVIPFFSFAQNANGNERRLPCGSVASDGMVARKPMPLRRTRLRRTERI